jgi:hypothetical protein
MHRSMRPSAWFFTMIAHSSSTYMGQTREARGILRCGVGFFMILFQKNHDIETIEQSAHLLFRFPKHKFKFGPRIKR